MPIDYTSANYDFFGKSDDFPAALAAAFNLQQTNAEALDADLALSNLVLHGTGRTASGCRLQVGTGLSVRITNGYHIAGGRIGQVAEDAGYKVAALTANTSNHIYMTSAGVVTTYAAKQGSNPTGTWYVGVAVANSSACTSVDDSGADQLLSLSDVDTELTAHEAEITALQTAVGIPYTDGASDLDARVTALESGGSGAGTVYWGALQKASADATTIDEAISSAVGSGGGAVASGTTPVTKLVQMPSDIEISNHMRLTLRLMHALPEVERTQIYSYYFLPGVSSTGLVDLVNTTATIDPVNHTIG